MLIHEPFYVEWEILVEDAEPRGSLCACELGKRLVFRSDFTVLVIMHSGYRLLQFHSVPGSGQSCEVIVLLNPQNSSMR